MIDLIPHTHAHVLFTDLTIIFGSGTTWYICTAQELSYNIYYIVHVTKDHLLKYSYN